MNEESTYSSCNLDHLVSHQHGCTMIARLPRIPAGERGVWSEPLRIQPDSH